MVRLQIADTEYFIERSNKDSFHLVWESATEEVKINPRTQKETAKPTWKKYYGALHQALVGFVRAYAESYPKGSTLDDIEERVDYAKNLVKGLMDKLSEADKEILEEWKIVKVSSN